MGKLRSSTSLDAFVSLPDLSKILSIAK